MLRARPSVRTLLSVFVAALAIVPGIAINQELQLDYRMNEHIVQVPAGPQDRAMLETTVFQEFLQEMMGFLGTGNDG